MIRRLLVANRGEIACRVFATCRSLGIETVAVHSDADTGAPHVRAADHAVRLPGRTPADTYLRGDLIVAAGVPVLSTVDPEDVERFPVLVKASAGGGGRGMRVVRDRAGLAEAVA